MVKKKEDDTQAILIVPVWADQPWFAELEEILVDSVELARGIKLYARDDTGPLRQRSWSTLPLLVDGRLSDPDWAHSDESCVGSENEVELGNDNETIFSDFCSSDAEGDPVSSGSPSVPLSPIRRDSEKIPHTKIKGNAHSRRTFRDIYEKPHVSVFYDLFDEIDDEDAQVHPSYLQQACDPDLFRAVRRGMLPSKAGKIAKVLCTVIPGDEVDSELCSKRHETIFEQRKDTTLSGKILKNPPVRGRSGGAFIELKQTYKAKKQTPYENHGRKRDILREIVREKVTEFGW